MDRRSLSHEEPNKPRRIGIPHRNGRKTGKVACNLRGPARRKQSLRCRLSEGCCVRNYLPGITSPPEKLRCKADCHTVLQTAKYLVAPDHEHIDRYIRLKVPVKAEEGKIFPPVISPHADCIPDLAPEQSVRSRTARAE